MDWDHTSSAFSRMSDRLPARRVSVPLNLVLFVGVVLRYLNTHHWFSYFNDYDEGAWALAARFLAEGHVPYREFVLVHPPFHTTVLGAVYAVFGYDFFMGRYLSIALSAVAIVLAYGVGRRVGAESTGLFAASLVAVAPNLVYFGRRIVQEPLGLVLVFGALYVVLGTDLEQPDRKPVFLAGGLLGLAVATKYVFIPAAFGVFAALLLVNIDEKWWDSARIIGQFKTWYWYGMLVLLSWVAVLFLSGGFGLSLPIPIIDPLFLETADMLSFAVVFLLPVAVLALAAFKTDNLQRGARTAVTAARASPPWILAAGGVTSFLLAAGPFILLAPQEFLNQTLRYHIGRSGTQFPSLLALVRLTMSNIIHLKSTSLYSLPVIASMPIALYGIRRAHTPAERFLSVAILGVIVMCQPLFYLQRYYVAVYPFLIVLVAAFVSATTLPTPQFSETLSSLRRRLFSNRDKSTLVAVLIVLVLLVSSLPIPFYYLGYDIQNTISDDNPEKVYDQTIEYVESHDADLAYATSPTILALSEETQSVAQFDSYAYMFLMPKEERKAAEEILQQNPDYVMTDPWIRSWGPGREAEVNAFKQNLTGNAELVHVIGTEAENVRIYKPTDTPPVVRNGGLVTVGSDGPPVDWRHIRLQSEGDDVSLSTVNSGEQSALELSVTQDGRSGGSEQDWAHTGIEQTISYPDRTLSACVLTKNGTTSAHDTSVRKGIQFTDEKGNRLVFTVSPNTTKTMVYDESEQARFVFLPVDDGSWSKVKLDVSKYWRTKWQTPKNVRAEAFVAAHRSSPGTYSLRVDSIGTNTECQTS
ncbi:ArnT family glycosyltransferase [Natrinema sp. CGMCC1.2065]|uniref:ArnT family glycosyltransferase n=1 Tax=Natrinema sp. CGMCC1.2065 TaxID=3445767 RepID=UPI003F49BE1B